MRFASVCLTFLFAAAAWLPAPDLFWWPQGASTDANDPANWSQGSTGYSPATVLNSSTNLRFFGSGTNLGDCIMTAPLTVGGISSTAGFFTTGTFSDGGFTLNVNGGIALESGLLAMTGDVVMTVPGATTVNLRLPPGQALPRVSVTLPGGSSVQMLSDISMASLTVTGSGTWLWGFERELTLSSALASAFDNTITLGQITQSGLVAGILWNASGGTLTLPSGQPLPRLVVSGSTTLASADGNEMLLDPPASLTVGDNATLTLASPLALTTGVTLIQGANSTIADGGGTFIWRQTVDFPAPLGTDLLCAVRIEQAGTASTLIDLPGGWAFGDTLTFVAHDDAVGLPDMHVTLLGPVSATDIDFTTLAPNTEIRVFFSDATSRLTASGNLSASGNYMLVAFQAAGFPISLNADSMSFTNPFTSVDFIFGVTEAADLVVNTAMDLSSGGTASDALSLELNGPGNGLSEVSLTLLNHTWDILKTGDAGTVIFQETADVRSVMTRSSVATDITGAISETSLNLPDGSQLTVADTGSTNGSTRFAINLVMAGLGTHTLTNETGDAILEVSGIISGAASTITDMVVDDGHIRISGADDRPGDGVTSRSFTYIDGANTIVEYLGNGFSVDVVARGADVQFRGTGQVLAFTSESLDPVSILPGDDVGTYGILTIDNADLRSAPGASDEADLLLKIGGDVGAGVDYDRLVTSNLTVDSGRTRITLDLSDWSQDDATVYGIITYATSITGDPLALSVSLIAASDITTELVHDEISQQINLIVTVDDGIVVPPPVSGIFRTPTIPVSTRRSTMWTAVCPGTAEGLNDLRAKLAQLGARKTRGFIWDPSTQAYVEFPAEPVGGLQPWHGWFIATTVPLNLNFQGTFDSAPHRVPLQSGWNLVGVGPVSDGIDITLFPLATLELRNSVDAPVTGGARSAVIGNTVAGWNTTAYRNVTEFTSGLAYWVFNADAADHELVYVTGSLIPIDVTSVVPAAAMPTPPPPPSLGDADADTASDSCGGGSGIGFLILLLAFSGLRRHRVLRP